jgi:hypothetical protein
MLKYFINWFFKPYPLIYDTINKLKLVIGVGLFIFVFLFAFQPFNFDDLEGNKTVFAFYYALITTVSMGVILFVFPYLFKKVFDPSKWVVYKMVLLIFSIIITISIANWYFTKNYINQNSAVHHSLPFFFACY